MMYAFFSALAQLTLAFKVVASAKMDKNGQDDGRKIVVQASPPFERVCNEKRDVKFAS